jgi:hypothetical protein
MSPLGMAIAMLKQQQEAYQGPSAPLSNLSAPVARVTGEAGQNPQQEIDTKRKGVHHGPSAPLDNLSAPVAICATTAAHAVKQPRLPIENLDANAPGAATHQCALKGG